MPDRPTHTPAELVDRARLAWKAQAAPFTSVRRILCEAAFSLVDPFAAEQLLARARQSDRLISLSTVYRTLAQLSEFGLLREIENPRGQRLFIAANSPAAGTGHVVCRDCGQVIALDSPCLNLREGALAREHGFSAKQVSVRIEATCDQLHSTGRCTRRSKQEASSDTRNTAARRTEGHSRQYTDGP